MGIQFAIKIESLLTPGAHPSIEALACGDCPIDGGVALYDHLPQPAMTRIVTASVDVA